MRWGQFVEVTGEASRRYVRGYWRFLLGWHESPSLPPSLTYKDRANLRRRAREEVAAYEAQVDHNHGEVIAFPIAS